MDRIGLVAALFDEGEAEAAAEAAQQAFDDAARIDSTLAASRLNTLLDAARPYETSAVDDVRDRRASDGHRGLRASSTWPSTADPDHPTSPPAPSPA
ncbi:hypothetical protein [Streptomyces sp. NPDC002587]